MLACPGCLLSRLSLSLCHGGLNTRPQLAEVVLRCGDVLEARKLASKALQLHQEAAGSCPQRQAATWTEHAGFLCKTGDHAGAERMLRVGGSVARETQNNRVSTALAEQKIQKALLWGGDGAERMLRLLEYCEVLKSAGLRPAARAILRVLQAFRGTGHCG